MNKWKSLSPDLNRMLMILMVLRIIRLLHDFLETLNISIPVHFQEKVFESMSNEFLRAI